MCAVDERRRVRWCDVRGICCRRKVDVSIVEERDKCISNMHVKSVLQCRVVKRDDVRNKPQLSLRYALVVYSESFTAIAYRRRDENTSRFSTLPLLGYNPTSTITGVKRKLS